MAAFNEVFQLVDKINKGVEIAKSVRALEPLKIPLQVARDTGLIEVLKPMASIGVLKEPIEKILGDLEQKEKEEAEEKKKAKRNELARMRRQQKKKAEKENVGAKGAPPASKNKKTPLMRKAMKQARGLSYVY